jgi:hypothetical protein
MNIVEDDHTDLSGLLRGELTNADVGKVADHLESCERCRDDLAELAVGHALLSAASRTFGGGVVTPNPAESLPLGASPSHRARRQRRLVAVAAAAVVIVGIGVAGALRFGSDSQPPAEQVFARAELRAIDGFGAGEISMVHHGEATTQMQIRTKDLPKPRQGRFYYAWLLDPDSNKMLPLGQVGPDGEASFTLNDELLTRYTAVDVSLESDDGDPQHSVTSVLRASYEPGAAQATSPS